MPKFDAVIFDLDDTLTMSEPACYAMENHALQQMGRAPMDRQVHIDTWGQALQVAIKVRSPGVNVEEFWPKLLKVHKEWIDRGHIDQISPKDIDVLNQLASAGILLAILTNRMLAEAEHFLEESHVLQSVMKEIYHTDVTGYRKPDPRVFDIFFKQHPHIDRQKVAYVGDAPTDEEVVYNANLGLAIITLESGLRKSSDFMGGDKTVFVDDLSQIPALVR